ncbi:MAG TPA: efflux transporter outer membrane subunit [Thermodesulfobacteriota bacterium]|nr:efflux transporter outer membrane subunit [Thermodesulfobacteriota bacterium]
MMLKFLILPIIFALMLSACMLGPNYSRPDLDVPQGWRLSVEKANEVANVSWWEQFNDPVLSKYIQTSLEQNKDLKIAIAVVQEYYARLGITRSELFPQLDAAGAAGRIRSSSSFLPSSEGVDRNFNAFVIAFNLSYELDIWGRIRRATEAARAELLSQEEAQRTVILTLVTSVASTYIDLLDLDKRLDIARQTLKSFEESLRLIELQFKGGIVSELEVRQAQSQVESAAVVIPQLETQIAQKENLLSVLLGKNPGAIERGRTIDELSLPNIPSGQPSDLLEQRPDILQAENQLIAANARIGEAKAEYFPKINLAALLGFETPELDNFFDHSSLFYHFGGVLAQPLFEGGRIIYKVKGAEAHKEQALFNYEQTILNALKEVNDALVGYKNSDAELGIQARQVAVLKDYLRLAELQYDEGLVEYLNVLDAQRQLFDAQLAQAQTQGKHFLNLVGLYKTLGGGWVVEAEKLSDSSQKLQN